MDPLERLIATARLRLRVQHAVARTPRIVITVAAVMLAALVLGKILPAVLPVWWITVSVLAAAGLAAFFALLLLDPPSRLHAAIEADRVLGLRDRLSVALASRGSSDPFARAAVADAEARAADPALRNTLRRGLPLEPPSGWWWAIPVLMAAALVQFLVPAWTQTAAADAAELAEARETAQETLAEVEAAILEQPELAAELGEDLALEGDEEGFSGLDDPEEIKLEAIRRMTALEERLESILASDAAAANEALRESLADLDVPQDGLAEELALAMRLGDFAAASEAIDALRERLERREDEGGLSEEERQQLAEELARLAEQLEQAAANREALDEALKAAGVDPQAAGELSEQDLERLGQALENAGNLNESQRQELMKMARSAQQSQQSTQAMSKAMKQMASQCEGGQSSGQGKFGSQAQEMLSDLEQMQAMLRQARAAQGACRGGAKGLGSMGFIRSPGSGSNDQFGPGMGGRGRGAGGVAPRQETETGTEVVREAGNIREGDIIARTLIEGELTVGEAKTPIGRIEQNLEAADPAAATAEDPVPPHLREAHRHYFGSLRKMVEEKQAAPAKPANAPAKPSDAPAKPAEAPAKPAAAGEGGA